jgi:hypothetical protein
MKKIWKIVIISVVVVLVGIQFIRPKKNDNLINPQNDIVFHLQVPTNVKKKLVDACYDCHSNKTRYPFYNNFAPISWMMANHVKNGKEHLNFSEWATYEKKEQLKLLTEICEVITNGEMPLKGYTLMHSSAVIDPGQLEAICAWTDQAGEELLGRKDTGQPTAQQENEAGEKEIE